MSYETDGLSPSSSSSSSGGYIALVTAADERRSYQDTSAVFIRCRGNHRRTRERGIHTADYILVHDVIMVALCTLCSKKVDRQTHSGNFVKFQPIFKILSMLDLAINLQ